MAANTVTNTQDVQLENNMPKGDIASKGNNKIKNHKTKKKGKIKNTIIILVVMAVLVSIFFMIGRFNILGLGNVISKIPGIGAIVSTSTKTNSKSDNTDSANIDVSKLSKKSLQAQLETQLKINLQLKKQRDSLLKNSKTFNDKTVEYNQTLKDYNNLKLSYKKLINQNADMQKAIVTANPSLFVKEYEKLNPTLSKQLYTSMKALTEKQQGLENNLKNMATYYTKMEPEVAANALVKMYSKNKTLTIEIMSRISNNNLPDIFANIDSDTVQKMTQDLYISGVKKVNNNY